MREEGYNQVIKCYADADCDIAKSACCITSSKPIGGGEYTEHVFITVPGMYMIRCICRQHHNSSTSVYCKIQPEQTWLIRTIHTCINWMGHNIQAI